MADNKGIPIGKAANLKDMKQLKEFIKMLCEQKGLTIKDFTAKINMNETGFHDRFKRKSITINDLDKMLEPFGLKLEVTEMTEYELQHRTIQLENK